MPTVPAAARLLAASDSGVLVRSFLLAVVLVSPFALRQWWKVRGARRLAEADVAAAAAALAPEPEPSAPRLEDVIAHVSEAGQHAATGSVLDFDVPADVTIDGSPAPEELVRALVGDALHRSDFDLVGEAGDEGGRVLTCRKR